MAEQAYAYVTLIPVAKGFKNAITKELGGVDGVGKSVGEKTGKGFLGGFKTPLLGLAAAAGGALASIGIGRFFKDSIKEASDLGESINAVNVSYGEFADDVLALGDDVAQRLGLSQADFNAAAVRFSAFTERIAGEGGNVAGVVDSLTTRAADFASVFNIEVSEALQVFQSGLSGEAEPLKRFGINLLDSEVRAYAAANGIGEIGRELTETEKVQARYGLLLESTAKTQGDFANTSDGLANSQRILQASLTNLRAQVGESLTPVVAKLVSSLVPLADEIFPKIADFVATKITPFLDRFATGFQDIAINARESGFSLGAIFDNLSMMFTDWIDGGGLKRMFERFLEVRQIIFDALATALPSIIQALVEFLPMLLTFFTDEVLPTLLDSLTFIVDEVSKLIVTLLPEIITALLGMIPDLLKAAIDVFDSLIEAVIEITPTLIQTIIDLLPMLITAVIDMLPDIITAAIDLFTGLIDGLVDVIPMLIDALIQLQPKITTAIIDALPKIIDAAFELFTGLINGLIDATPDIIDAVIALIPQITGALLANIPKLVEAGFEIVRGLAKGIIDNAPRILGNAIKSIGDTLVNGVKDFLGIRSPSRVFIGIGEDVGNGMIVGISSMMGEVKMTAEELADLVTGPVDTAIEKLKDLRTYTGYDPEAQGPAINPDGSLNVRQLTNDFNSALNYMGQTTVAGINQAAQDLFGGSMQQVLDALNPNPQATLIDPRTGMQRTIGAADEQSLAMAVERAIAEGFTQRLEPIAVPIDQLTKSIEDLNQTVAREGLTPFADGGMVTGPTPALIGEAGPEVVIPLDRFERMMGMTDSNGKTLNYYAAPNQSVDSEAALFQAMRRAKVVASW